MNYNYLRYFSVLAQVEHYTLAAARLGISQPSLSSAIHHLESELGDVKLFEKVGRNIRLTEEGRYYREKVDAALQELNTASMTLRDSKVSAPVVIRMGVISGMDTTNRDRSLHFRKLGQKNVIAALPVAHPLAQSEFVLPQQISHEPQVVFNYDIENSFGQWASGDTVEERVLCTVNTAQAALNLVSAGAGICVLSEECVQPREDVCYVPVKNWYQALYMCILYDKWLEPPVWGFVEKLVKVIRSLERENKSLIGMM